MSSKTIGDDLRWQLRAILAAAQGGLCALCGKPMTNSQQTLDHIIPASKGGSDEIENLRVAHELCNKSRDTTIRLRDLELHAALTAVRSRQWGTS